MPSHWYLAPRMVPREYDPSQPVIVAVTNFITSFILYSERGRPRLPAPAQQAGLCSWGPCSAC